MAARSRRDELLEFALSFPGAEEHFPWGESVVKVGGKVFVFLGTGDGDPSVVGCSVKLPESGQMAIDAGLGTPTGYGLGKSGWVSVRAESPDRSTMELLHDWIEESYRTVALKKFVAELDQRGEPGLPAPTRPPRASRSPSSAPGDTTVSGFLEAHSAPVARLTERVLAALQRAHPEFEAWVRSGWGAITLHHPEAGYVCGLFPGAEGVKLVFEHGAALADPDRVLRGGGRQTRHVELQSFGPKPRQAVLALLDAAVAFGVARSLR